MVNVFSSVILISSLYYTTLFTDIVLSNELLNRIILRKLGPNS